MRFILFISFLLLAGTSQARVIEEFLREQPLTDSGNYEGAEKDEVIKFTVRGNTVHAVVEYVHIEGKHYIISLNGIKMVKSMGPIEYAGYPVYSTLLIDSSELQKRKLKYQSYGAISSEEGNGFCRAAFGDDYHLARQNPTASRKTVEAPWYLSSVTCEGPKISSFLTK